MMRGTAYGVTVWPILGASWQACIEKLQAEAGVSCLVSELWHEVGWRDAHDAAADDAERTRALAAATQEAACTATCST
jgi:hypothetical protein